MEEGLRMGGRPLLSNEAILAKLKHAIHLRKHDITADRCDG